MQKKSPSPPFDFTARTTWVLHAAASTHKHTIIDHQSKKNLVVVWSQSFYVTMIWSASFFTSPYAACFVVGSFPSSWSSSPHEAFLHLPHARKEPKWSNSSPVLVQKLPSSSCFFSILPYFQFTFRPPFPRINRNTTQVWSLLSRKNFVFRSGGKIRKIFSRILLSRLVAHVRGHLLGGVPAVVDLRLAWGGGLVVESQDDGVTSAEHVDASAAHAPSGEHSKLVSS